MDSLTDLRMNIWGQRALGTDRRSSRAFQAEDTMMWRLLDVGRCAWSFHMWSMMGETMHGLIVKGLDLLPKIETGRGTESLGTGERRSLRDRGFLCKCGRETGKG